MIIFRLSVFAGTNPLIKRLKPTAVPHIFVWKKTATPAQMKRRDRIQRKVLKEKKIEAEGLNTEIGAEMEITTDTHIPGMYIGPIHPFTQPHTSVGVQICLALSLNSLSLK